MAGCVLASDAFLMFKIECPITNYTDNPENQNQSKLKANIHVADAKRMNLCANESRLVCRKGVALLS